LMPALAGPLPFHTFDNFISTLFSTGNKTRLIFEDALRRTISM